MLCVLVNIRFQVLFHSAPAVLFTFPSRYFSTIGHQVVFRLGRWSSRVPTGLHVSGGTLDPRHAQTVFRYRTFTLYGQPSQVVLLTVFAITQVLTPAKLLQLVWPPPRSLATTSGISVDVFSWPYLDVSVQAVPHVQLWIHCTLTQVCCAGFPHSEISGSMLICSSPKLIAACHVFHRLLMPRHSPCTLYSLTSSAQAPHPSCPPLAANTHSFRCASSRSEMLRISSRFLVLDGTECGLKLRSQGYFSFGHLWFSKEKLELCRLPFGFNCSLLPFYY